VSIDKCTPELLANGQISEEQARRFDGLYHELESDYSTKYGAQAAKAMASEETLRRLGAEAAQAKRQAMLQVSAQQRISLEAKSFDGPSEKAMAAFIAADDRAPYDNVEYRLLAVEGQAHAMVDGILHDFSRNLAGKVRNKAELHNLVREAFGEKTGDQAASELAQAWGRTADMLRNRFNAAGGAIGKIENWGLPQTHNMETVRSVPFNEWRDYIAPRLDRAKMLDPATSMPMTPQGLEMALRSVYEKVRSDGWTDRTPGGQFGIGKVANRHADSRFLVFKDADSWMEYGRKFGRPVSRMGEALDPDGFIFDAMMGHISSMSRDIALTEVLGPNPAASIRWMIDTMKRDAAVSTDQTMGSIHRAQSGANKVQSLFNEVAGRQQSPEYGLLARAFSSFRSYQAAAKLGSATISATTDMGFQQVTRRFNGLPAAKQVASYAKMLNPASSGDRRLAIRMGLVAREASKRAVAQSRFVGTAITGETSARLAEATMRASGLSAWTQAGQWAFGMDFYSHITHVAGQSFDTLAPAFRRTLDRYGIDSPKWDAIRSTELEEHQGSHWIMPDNIKDQAIADRVRRMVLTETDFAVPNVTLSTRALFNQIPKGTLFWEIVRAPLLFKTFSASVMMTHGARMMRQQAYNKLAYGASLAVTTGIMGALAMQMQHVSKGLDPQPMEDPVFWGQAMMQGGGLGIFGDFMRSATSRFDDDIYSTFAGPAISDLVSVVKMGKEGLKAATGQTSHPGRQAIKILKADLPGGSLWYAKLAFQRTMLDQMQKQIDPDYYDAFDRMQQRAQQNGQHYYWAPGEVSAERGPDLTNAAKAAPVQ
jgi:hypothetical protein